MLEDMYKCLDTTPAFDRQTSCDGIVRAMHMRHAIKTNHRFSDIICCI